MGAALLGIASAPSQSAWRRDQALRQEKGVRETQKGEMETRGKETPDRGENSSGWKDSGG